MQRYRQEPYHPSAYRQVSCASLRAMGPLGELSERHFCVLSSKFDAS
jgi:hypothetical protein